MAHHDLQAVSGPRLRQRSAEAGYRIHKDLPCGKAEYCRISCEPENEVAKKLYASLGFEESGEMCGDEAVALLKL